MFKHLTIGDLHLYDKEMRSTKKMVENSRYMLDQLYKYLLDNEDIVLLNINGDIQHDTPNNKENRIEVAHWRYMFRKIGELMAERFKKFDGYSLAGASKEVKEAFKNKKINPIFTTIGNHDKDEVVKHTFYHDLLQEGLIMNVDGLLVKTGEDRTYFSYRDHETSERKLPKFKTKTHVIALEHDDILHVESSLWNVPNAEKKFLKAEDVVVGTDVTILHHIHDSVDPIFIELDDVSKPVLWQVGSMGRTSFIDAHKRNVGYGALMVFGDVENFKRIEIDLIPYQEYFSYQKVTKKKEYQNEFKDFNLNIEEQERISTNYADDINSFKNIEDEVKEYAIGVMDKVNNRNAV